MDSKYPPSPAEVPDSLTRTTPGYALRVAAMLVGLLSFVLLYGAIGVGLGYAIVGLWGLPVSGRGGFYLIAGGTVALAVPLLFLVKGLFFRERAPLEGYVEVTRAEQPTLFSFLDRLTEESRAPKPRRVYLSPGVNAAVFYEPSLLSLVWPTPKNLVVGLGLVNYLTVSELKAVLGHELGHFSQRAMKVGSYVYVANRVVVNLVHGRDALDDLLERGKRSDPRLALLAYLAAGIVGTIRFVLRMAFELLALGHTALARQMEFAADRAAVAVAGGDAIARGLYKAEVADACFHTTLGRLSHAADQGLVTDDFYLHQTSALEEVRRRARQPSLGDVTARKEGFLFAPDTTSKPSMWASHPPSAERERAARATGVEAAHDERPAWVLFDAPQALRERLTTELVRLNIRHAKGFPRKAAEIEALFQKERRDEARAARHGEMYSGRPLAKLDLPAIFARTPRPSEALAAAHAALYGGRVEALSERFRALQRELQLLMRARRGEVRPEALVIDGRVRSLREAEALGQERIAGLGAIDREFEKLDVEVANVHAEMAIELGPKHAARLRRRYAETARLSGWIAKVGRAEGAALEVLRPVLAGKKEKADLLIERLGDLDAAVSAVLATARDRKAPRLPNVNRDHSMAQFLLPRRTAGSFEPGSDPNTWMQAVLGQTAEVLDKLRRLHTLAISALLAELEAIHTAWATRDSGASEASASESSAASDEEATDEGTESEEEA